VAELDLRPGGIVPKDATTLVLPGPRRSLTIEETGVLRSYLANGGGLFVLIDPNPPADVRRVLTELGVTIEDGTLIDPDSHVVPNLDVPLVGRAKNGFALAQTYFPGATAIIPNPEMPRELDIAALVWTSEASWLERDDRNADAPTFDPETDRKGPFAIGVLVPASASEEGGASQGGRLAIFGDSDFATNRHFQNGNNGDLFVSVVSWVTADKRLVTVERKNLNLRRLILSPEAARLVNLSSIGLLPLILFVAGGHLWWRRR
jgi:ABC-type uncharacterized transport system involved in gliding motility auxiliary subunit